MPPWTNFAVCASSIGVINISSGRTGPFGTLILDSAAEIGSLSISMAIIDSLFLNTLRLSQLTLEEVIFRRGSNTATLLKTLHKAGHLGSCQSSGVFSVDSYGQCQELDLSF